MSMFNDFSELEVREETIPEKSDLEKVLDIEDEILNEKWDIHFNHLDEEQKEDVFYSELYKNCKKRLEGVSLSSDLLQLYLDSRENTDDTVTGFERGYFSAILLELYCLQNPKKPLFLDGRNKIFHELFSHARYVSNLTLRNVYGEGILSRAGIHGKIENVFIENIIGNFLLYEAGMSGGQIKNILVKTVKGNSTLEYAATGGTGENITVMDIQGDRTLISLGKNSGRVQFVQAINIQGNFTLSFAGSEKGEVNYVTLANSRGMNLLNGVKEVTPNHFEGRYLPPVNKLILRDMLKDQIVCTSINPDKFEMYGKIFTQKDGFEEYEHITIDRQRIVDDILTFATSEESEKDIHELERLYGELFKETFL